MPDTAEAVEAGRHWVQANNDAFVRNREFGSLLDVFSSRCDASETLLRTFPNLCPLPGLGPTPVVNGFVTAPHPRYHDLDLSQCPVAIVAAMVDAWKVFHQLCMENGWVLLPYANCGRNRRSGQSFAHPHGQHLILGGVPPLFARLKDARRIGKCRVCELLSMEDLHIEVPGHDAFVLMADPAPIQSWGLYMVSRVCDDDLAKVDSTAFASLFISALQKLSSILGAVPAYNLVVRVGTGHLHAEVFVRSTNTVAGAEIGTLEFFNDAPASFVAASLRTAAGVTL